MENKRILVKFSGEALEKDSKTISKEVLDSLFFQIKYLKDNYNLDIAIVIGGGNIFRGKISEMIGMGKDTVYADYMGMLATTINAIAIWSFFNNKGLKTDIYNTEKLFGIIPKFTPKRVENSFKRNSIVIFGGGTGKPYVSTDTAASLRAIQIKADSILMAKNNIDGLYDDDPNQNEKANFINKITFSEVYDKKLQAFDLESVEMLMLTKENIQVVIFDMAKKDALINVFKEDNQIKKTIISKK